MKENLDKIKLMEIEALSEFEEDIEKVLVDLDIYREYVSKKRLKELNRCYDYLDTLWESIEDTIAQISDADERGKRNE